MKDSLGVYLHDVPVGEIFRMDDGRIDFDFDVVYARDPLRDTLSQSFLSSDGGVRNAIRATSAGLIHPFYANLLPEGDLRKYIAEQAGVTTIREFDMLELLGEDLPGAVVVRRERGTPSPVQDDASDARTTSDKPLRFSLAGVQLKFSAIENPLGGLTIPAYGIGGDWIVKLPSAHYESVPDNEYSVMSMAGLVGLPITEMKLMAIGEIEGLPPEIGDLDETRALVIRRFDRVNGLRIHMEDFAQAMTRRPEDKYAPQLNCTHLTRLVAGSCNEDDVIEFSRRLMFNNIVGNGDMHLKNWSFIYPDGHTAELSPVYDFLCTTRYIRQDKLAFKMGSTNEWHKLTLDDFAVVAEGAGVNKQTFVDAAADTVVKFHDRWEEFTQALPVDDDLKRSIERQMTRCPAITACLRRKSPPKPPSHTKASDF